MSTAPELAVYIKGPIAQVRVRRIWPIYRWRVGTKTGLTLTWLGAYRTGLGCAVLDACVVMSKPSTTNFYPTEAK